MASMKNGVCVVQCEVALLLSAMRRGSRWTGHARSEEEQDPLIHGLYTLQDTLSRTPSLSSMEAITFLKPFCDIVQSDDTTGPITGMAITSLDKFLAYGLIDPLHPSAAVGIENLSEAVTHARFVGTNPASDEVVLMKILQVLHTLMLTPVGCLLSNESVCEIMQSCFRICFEMRLSELLRCYAEGTLVDMVQLLFSRLPTFTDDSHSVDDTSSMDQTLTTPQNESENKGQQDTVEEEEEGESHDPEVPIETETESHDQESVESTKEFVSSDVFNVTTRHKHGTFTPYGLPCVRELMRFLISIINVRDRHNSEPLIAIGLNLVTVAIECGSVHLCQFPSLAGLVQDGLCRNLLSLLRHNGFTLYSRALRASYLLFERGRQNLKLQLESFMNLLMDIVSADNSRVPYDRKELALECIVQLCHVSHFTPELYVNFDCGLYCSNVFERLTKMLSKNAFPTQGLLSTHLLSLDALLAIVNSLEHNQAQEYKMKRHSETPATLHVSLSMRHKPGSSSTQLNSAGIIFTSTHEQEEEVTSSDEQEVMSSRHAVQSDSEVVSQEVDSAEFLDTSEQSCDVTLSTTKAPSGYQMAVGMGKGEMVRGGGVEVTLPTSKQLLEVRQKKKLILAATEQFNKKPSHGVAFLVEQGILPSPPPPEKLAEFLLQNPALSKAMIGDYIGDRKNAEVLEAFVKNHSLRGVPLVEALRQFLESFRLPGESPIVERILGIFSKHWLECNHDDVGRVFANVDAVHVMSYAILMLNTDLHNNQVKKKMTLEEWIRNQRKTNNGEDFPPEFLTEMYHRIKENEIIMPDEHTGVVRENYKWKVLLHRSASPEGTFLPVSSSEFDQDLFLLVWGPAIAALSYVFDNAEEKSIVQKALQGFSQCASVAAHYELREVFDNLIISLCKFTSLLNTHEPPNVMFLSIGLNQKVRHSIQTVFTLAHRHANILREGWKNLLDCLLALFKAKLLPEGLVEVEDFLHPEGKVSLFREETPVRTDSSLLSSLYFYWVSNDQSGKVLTPSEIRARKTALKCVKECHPEQLFSESKFLRQDSLLELMKALTFASRGPEHHQTLGTLFDEDSAVFFLELLVSVALENKDRIGLFWSELSNHLSRIILTSHRHRHLLERAVVGMLRLAIRLMSRESLAPQLLSSLRVLLTLPPPTTPHMKEIHKQVSNGATELIHSHAGTIKTPHDWSIFFTILEYTGTGLSQYTPQGQVTIETVTMETTSHEMGVATTAAEEIDFEARDGEQTDSSTHQLASDWVWISEPEGVQRPSMSLNQFDLLVEEAIPVHEPHAFFKSCETLAYLVRSDPYVTSANFSGCVHSIRTFSEISSSSYAIEYDRIHTTPPPKPGSKRDRTRSPTRITQPLPLSSQKSGSSLTYTTVSLRLLDLLDALYSRVGRIFDAKTIASLQEEIKSMEKRAKTQPKPESDEMKHEDQSSSQPDLSSTSANQGTSTQDRLASPPLPHPYCPEADQDRVSFPGTAMTSSSLLWHMAWCPLLQGMARMCCDVRRSVRQTAITYLQRALLAHGLQSLSAQEWEACFLEVFFPMLSRLLEDIATSDHVGLEETRVRASNLLCKVFLQHLPSLSQLQNFPELWLGILDFMDKFLHLNNSDLLYEAIPESLKNMLLVMSTQGIFDITINSTQSNSSIALSKEVDSARLWSMTWTRIDQFLPGFLKDLFPDVTPPAPPPSSPPPSPQPASQQEQGDLTPRQSAQSEGIPMASAPISVSQSPTQSPDRSPHASPPSSSPVPEIQAAAEVGAFPITLHPPLPSLMHPRDQAHLLSGQTELDTSQTGLEPSHTALPDPSRGPPVLLQPTPPYGPTLDSDSQSSNIQNPTTQFSTVFSV